MDDLLDSYEAGCATGGGTALEGTVETTWLVGTTDWELTTVGWATRVDECIGCPKVCVTAGIAGPLEVGTWPLWPGDLFGVLVLFWVEGGSGRFMKEVLVSSSKSVLLGNSSENLTLVSPSLNYSL